jgi:preprotein translocase subunit SecY
MKDMLQSRFGKELLLTLAIIAIYRVLVFIPLPFFDVENFNTLLNPLLPIGIGTRFEPISIAALGIMPFVSAFITIEIASLFLPPFKKYRQGDYHGRKILRNYALYLTLILSVIQAVFIIRGFSETQFTPGSSILVVENNAQYAALLVTQVATVFLTLFLAEIITRHGIGNGISLILLSSCCSVIFNDIGNFFYHSSRLQGNFFYIVVFFLAVSVLAIFLPILFVKSFYKTPFKHHSDDYKTNFFSISFCMSGKEAIGLASQFISIFYILLFFLFDYRNNSNFFNQKSIEYYTFICIAVFVFSTLFSWLFFSPTQKMKTLRGWGWTTTESGDLLAGFSKTIFLLYSTPWTIFLCCIALISTIPLGTFDTSFFIHPLCLVTIAMVSLDIFSRAHLRLKHDGDLYKIAELHDVYYAAMIKNHLASEQIAFHMQGFYHRHLLYFFGPFIPINLMVPSNQLSRVEEIMTRYYGSVGLVEHNNENR